MLDGRNGIRNNVSIQDFKNCFYWMATNIENLVQPLTILFWSSILHKNNRLADSKPWDDDISLSNTITKDIMVQRVWKVVDHGLNWDLENRFHIPENKIPRFCLKLFHLIQNTKDHLLNYISSEGNIKTRSHFRWNTNHDSDDDAKSRTRLNKQSDDLNKFKVGFINTQWVIFKKNIWFMWLYNLCDSIIVNKFHLLGSSDLKSNQIINKPNFIWLDKPTKETVEGLGILYHKDFIINENKESL